MSIPAKYPVEYSISQELFLGSVPASICDFVRAYVRMFVDNQFVVPEMTTFN